LRYYGDLRRVVIFINGKTQSKFLKGIGGYITLNLVKRTRLNGDFRRRRKYTLYLVKELATFGNV